MIVEFATSALPSRYLIEGGFAAALAASLWHRHWGYAVFLALALAEAHAGLRYPFHVWVRDEYLGYPGSHAEKIALQYTLFKVAGLVGLVAVLAVAPTLLRVPAGRRLMIGGAGIVFAILALELISAHDVDRMIYHREGPFARVAIAYFIAAAAIACGALMTSPSPRRTAAAATAAAGAEGEG